MVIRESHFTCFVMSPASHAFPFVKKRLEIVDRKEVTLTPIEVAVDQMQSKVIDMKEVVNLARPDLKKLQLRLQGSVSAQVELSISALR